MNKRGWEIAKLAQFIIVVIALIFVLNFVKGKMAYGSGIFSNLFGKVNESIGGVSWSDLTKEQKNIMNDKQKAESMFIEINKELNLGIEKRKNKLFDEARVAFGNALKLVNQILSLKGITKLQNDKAKDLEKTLQYYLKDLEAYKGVAEYLEKTKGVEDDAALKILKECEADYPRSIRSIDCLVNGYILKANLHSVDITGDLKKWFELQSASAENDPEKFARLNLAAGEILYQLSLEPNLDSKALLEEAIRYYNQITNDNKYKELYDYIGRAYHRKAQIYKNLYKTLGMADADSGFAKATTEYAELFKRLGGREFVDKQEALREQSIVRLGCYQLKVFKYSGGEEYLLTSSNIGKLDLYGETRFQVVSQNKDICPISGVWQLQLYLKREGILKEVVNIGPTQMPYPYFDRWTEKSRIVGDDNVLHNIKEYDVLSFKAYKDGKSNPISLDVPIK